MSDALINARPVVPDPNLRTASLPPQQPVQTGKNAGHGQAAKLARDFEGVFAGQVVKTMMESAEVKSEFTGGAGESMFRGILAEQIGNQIAHGQGLGIASAVEAQIIRMQEGK